MKTIVEVSTGLSKFVLDDDVAVTLGPNNIVIHEPVTNTVADLSEDSAVVYEGVTDVPADWIGNAYVYDGTTWATVEAHRAAERRATMACTPRQARLALASQGLYEAVQTTVVAISDQARIEWEYATMVERTSPLIDSMKGALGMTDEDLDNLFELAVTL